METVPAAAPRSRTRRYLTIALVIALAVFAGRLVEDYRYEHRDEYDRFAVPWSHFTTSPDGRTLSFVGAVGAPCYEPHHVEVERGRRIVATVYYEIQRVRDGQAIFCSAVGVIGLPPVSITLDEPLPAGALVVDGFDPNQDIHTGCRESGPGQRVGDPAPPATYPFC